MIEEASAALIETQKGFGKVMSPPGIPFAVGPLASLKDGSKIGPGNVENFAADEETATHLMEAMPHGYNKIVVEKTGLYLAILSGKLTCPIEEGSGPREAALRLRVNTDDPLTPGLLISTTTTTILAEESGGHSHTISFADWSKSLEASHVRVLYLTADDYVCAHLSGAGATYSCSDVRLELMFLCARPPS